MCVIYTFVLSVVLGSWGPFLEITLLPPGVETFVPCLRLCHTQNHHWGSHLALGEPLWKKAWGYKFCPILELMLGGSCCLAWAALLCAAGKSLWQRQPLLALLLWCSPRAGSLGKGCPAATMPRAPLDVHVTPDFVPLAISSLDTRGSAEHSTEAFRPQGGSACWLFKFISRLPP